MKLIDVDAFLERTRKDPLFPLVERYGLSRVIQSEPTVDAIPVKYIINYLNKGGEDKISSCLKEWEDADS